MKTNFFSQIKPLLESGMDLTLSFKLKDEKLIIAARPNYANVKDKSINQVKPLLLENSVEAFDDHFIETISAPMQTFVSNAERIKAYEECVKSTAGAKVNASKSKEVIQKEKDQEKAKSLLSEAKNFIKEEKFHQAISRLEKAKELDAALTEVGDLIKESQSKIIDPCLKKAKALVSVFQFKEVFKELAPVYKLDPKHTDLLQIEKSISDKVGDTVFNQIKKSVQS